MVSIKIKKWIPAAFDGKSGKRLALRTASVADANSTVSRIASIAAINTTEDMFRTETTDAPKGK